VQAETHEVRISHLGAWLASQGKTPREQALKVKLRGVLGSNSSRPLR
jgi:hypothetical protein